MEDDEILKYSMQIAMLKQLLNKKLIDEKEYEKIKKENWLKSLHLDEDKIL